MTNQLIEQPTQEQLDFLGLGDKPIVNAILSNNGETKAGKAREIWNDEVVKNKGGCPVRGHTIKRLMDEAELTKAGAATYYQNMKKKAGFVNSK